MELIKLDERNQIPEVKEEIMGKIVIVGNAQDVMHTIHSFICEGNQVQHCPMKLANVQSMVRIVKPDIFIFCMTDVEDIDEEIFHWIDGNCKTTPVLLAVSEEVWELLAYLCKSGHYSKITVPVDEQTLVGLCNRLLAAASVSGGAEGESESSGLRRVLIVDDSAVVLRNVKSLLQDEYEVVLATSGKMALKIVEKRHPDIILLDYEMPEMDGRETLEEIRNLPEGRNVPVLFLTSVSDRERILSVLHCNPAGYILKPPNQEKLLQMIAEALHK